MQSSINPEKTEVSAFFSALRKGIPVLLAVVIAVSADSARAEAPVLSLPADCDVGKTCWLVNFVDHDPGPGTQDFRCGHLSYNTHKGTDIAIADDAAMRRGVRVLAAAPGRVARVRDGVADSTKADLQSATALRGRECGNGLVIEHAGGWSTQYCHMKAGSLRVQPGDTVGRGAVLGEIGRSGRSEFPHIHMTVRDGTRVIDPFTATSNINACNVAARPAGLWAPDVAAALTYPGPQPFNAGFATGAPTKAEIEAGTLAETRFAAHVPALVFWAEAFSLDRGDRIVLTLSAPDGTRVAEHQTVIDRPLAKWHGFAGRKRRGAAWDAGIYTGRIEITRGGDVVVNSATATVE